MFRWEWVVVGVGGCGSRWLCGYVIGVRACVAGSSLHYATRLAAREDALGLSILHLLGRAFVCMFFVYMVMCKIVYLCACVSLCVCCVCVRVCFVCARTCPEWLCVCITISARCCMILSVYLYTLHICTLHICTLQYYAYAYKIFNKCVIGKMLQVFVYVGMRTDSQWTARHDPLWNRQDSRTPLYHRCHSRWDQMAPAKSDNNNYIRTSTKSDSMAGTQRR